MERVTLEFRSHGKRLLVPALPHLLQGGTGPIYLKSGMWEEAGPGLKGEDISVWAWKSKLQDIYLSTFLKKSAYLPLDVFSFIFSVAN